MIVAQTKGSDKRWLDSKYILKIDTTAFGKEIRWAL